MGRTITRLKYYLLLFGVKDVSSSLIPDQCLGLYLESLQAPLIQSYVNVLVILERISILVFTLVSETLALSCEFLLKNSVGYLENTKDLGLIFRSGRNQIYVLSITSTLCTGARLRSSITFPWRFIDVE